MASVLVEYKKKKKVREKSSIVNKPLALRLPWSQYFYLVILQSQRMYIQLIFLIPAIKQGGMLGLIRSPANKGIYRQ